MRKIRCSILMACFHHLLRNEFGWSSYFTRVFGNSKRIFTSVLVMLVLFCWGFLWYKGNKKQENTHTHKQKLGGGFKHFLFSSLPGELIQFDEHIFQMGWFNHQLEKRETFPPGFGDHLVLTDTFLPVRRENPKLRHKYGLTWLCTNGGCSKSRWSLRLVVTGDVVGTNPMDPIGCMYIYLHGNHQKSTMHVGRIYHIWMVCGCVYSSFFRQIIVTMLVGHPWQERAEGPKVSLLPFFLKDRCCDFMMCVCVLTWMEQIFVISR